MGIDEVPADALVLPGAAMGAPPDGTLYLIPPNDDVYIIACYKFFDVVAWFVRDGEGAMGDGLLATGGGAGLKPGKLIWRNKTGWK